MKKGLSLLCLLAMLLSLVTAMTVGTAAQPSPDGNALRFAAKATTAPEIDGEIDDIWKTTVAMPFETPGYGYIKALWEKKALYLMAELHDCTEITFLTSTKFYNKTDKGAWNWSGNYALTCTATTDSSAEDYTPNAPDFIKKTWNGWAFSGGDKTATQAIAKAKATKDGFIVEVKIPLPENKTDEDRKADGFFGLGAYVNGDYKIGNCVGIFKTARDNELGLTKSPYALYAVQTVNECKHILWHNASCLAPKTCIACGKTEGEIDPYSHFEAFVPETITEEKHKGTYPCCKTVVDGAHGWSNSKVSAIPTLVAPGTETGTCPICKKEQTRTLPVTAIQMLGDQATDVVDGKYSVRFVSQIATLEDFSEVGYQITLSYGKKKDALTGGGATKIWKTKTVFTSIQAGDKPETPNAEEGGKYLVAVPVTDIPVSDEIKFVKFEVTPFTVSLTGEITYAAGSGAAYVYESGKRVESVRLASDTTVPQLRTDPKTGKTLNLVWSDEFNSSTLDSTKWNLTQETWNKKVNYTTDKKNFRLENGEAVMNLYRKEDGEHLYSSNTTLTTKDRMSFKYGYLEIYAKVPFSQGSFPAFWFRSAVKHRSTNYVMAEVDVFEVYQKGCAESTLHKWFLRDPVKGNAYRHFSLDSPMSKKFPKDKWETLSDEYHLWGFGWTKDMMYMTVDGEVFATYDITDQSDFLEREVTNGEGFGEEDLTGMDCFQDPLYILFSNEPGISFRDSNWAPNENTVFPKTFSVKWVRLYQDSTGELYNDLA